MKRFICFLVLYALISMTAGCSSSGLESNSVFYYCRNSEEYQYFEEDGVISAENRDLSGHNNDLRYMVALYLAGPLEEDLICPFPRSTRLIEATKQDASVLIELSDLGDSLTDSEFSLAAACLSKTCMLYTGSSDITIKSGVRIITMNADNMILLDTVVPETTEEG